MRDLLCAVVVCGLFTASASAQVRIFLDPIGVGEQEIRFQESGYGNPVAGPGPSRLFIYGEFLGENDLWLALNFNITASGNDISIVGGSTYNHRTGNGFRWSVNGGTVSPAGAFEFRTAWIGDPAAFPAAMWNWDEAFATARTGDRFNAADLSDDKHYRRAFDSQGGGLGTTLLGFIDIEGTDGELFMTVESPVFARLGGTSQNAVFFGYGDAPVTAGAIGVRTALPAASIIPAPGAIALFGLGGLVAMRRRRH